MQNLRREQVLGLFTLFSGFMQEFCWGPAQRTKQNWIPQSKVTLEQKEKESQWGKTRREMQKSITLLAMMEACNVGIEPKRVEHALFSIKNWKLWFCKFLESKEDLQLKQKCLDNIRMGLKIGKPYKCNHANHLLGKKGASELADNIIKATFDSEVRAFNEPTDTWMFARPAGPVEFGESMVDEKYLPRQFVELPQGPEFRANEDETCTGFSLLDQMNWGSDDEVVEPDMDFKTQIIDFEAQNSDYFDLRREILHAKNSHQRELIVRRSENMAKFDQLPAFRSRQLRYFAWQCNMYKERINVEQTASQSVTDAPGEEEWITL